MAVKEITLEEIKEFAHSQLGQENPAITVNDGEFDIADPWYSITSQGKYLSDREAKDFWGDDLVNQFIIKARTYLGSK